MKPEEILEYFHRKIYENENISVGIAAIETLMEILRQYDSNTVQGLDENLKVGMAVMNTSAHTVACMSSGCELFKRFITYAKLDTSTFEECKNIMVERGEIFLNNVYEARVKIAEEASEFIDDGARILTHGKSRVVLQTLKVARKQRKRFEVFVTISAPDNFGNAMYNELKACGIPCTVVSDTAVGYIMEQVDFVMVGAEAVVESGGIINKVGCFTMSVCAREMKKSLYVLAETYKFLRYFPLNQMDIPVEYQGPVIDWKKHGRKRVLPIVDYTPSKYITLFFTEIGILTPPAVSDELIKIYV